MVTLSGRDHYCGEYGTPEAEAKYNRLIAEWVAAGRKSPTRVVGGISTRELARRWQDWGWPRYVKRGQPTSYAKLIRLISGRVAGLYGETPASEFGPTALKAIRAGWVEAGLSRRTVNTYSQTLVNLFRWGVGEDLIPAEVLVRLEAVKGLTSRDGVREGDAVDPVPRAVLEAVAGVLSEPAGTVLRLMACTGLRPAEACAVRPGDLDRSGPVWWYRVDPAWNKTDHKGKRRDVPLGPLARAILGPLVDRAASPSVYLFPGRSGKRPYHPKSLRARTRAACDRLGVRRFHPNQVRHLYLSEVRSRFGLEAAQTIAGHSTLTTTQIYAEADRKAGERIAAEMG